MACCGTALYAQMQDSGQAPPSAQAGGSMQRMPTTADQRLQHMTQMLNLSSDQQTKIRPILDNESQQMQALRSDTSMSREDRMAKMKSIREATNSQITPILTSEQQQKWSQMQSHTCGRRLAPWALRVESRGHRAAVVEFHFRTPHPDTGCPISSLLLGLKSGIFITTAGAQFRGTSWTSLVILSAGLLLLRWSSKDRAVADGGRKIP